MMVRNSADRPSNFFACKTQPRGGGGVARGAGERTSPARAPILFKCPIMRRASREAGS